MKQRATIANLAAMILISATGVAVADKDDAAALYGKAAMSITTSSPADSNLEYPGYPPYGPEWDQMAQTSWEKNGETRGLIRQARGIDRADWPDGKGVAHLNQCRRLMSIIVDAALLQHFRGEDREAIETCRDLMHLSEMLREDMPQGDLTRLLVGIGIDAATMHRVMTITSGITLTSNPANNKALQTREAEKLIKQLLDGASAHTALTKLKAEKGDKQLSSNIDADINRAEEQANRADAERVMAAMSLACYLFKADKSRWPATLEELKPFLPRLPIDPWGRGGETYGYALIKGGLPDGSDRPLVYSRCESKDGLFFRIDQPQYSFYSGDGSETPRQTQKRGGQFRDVARWVPKELAPGSPTIQLLE